MSPMLRGNVRYSYIMLGPEEVSDIFETLPDTGDDKEFEKACQALTKCFTPKKNVSVEIFKF